jgi:hypothetical protein
MLAGHSHPSAVANGVNEVVLGNAFENSLLCDPGQQPTLHPPDSDLLCQLLWALLRDEKETFMIFAERKS